MTWDGRWNFNGIIVGLPGDGKTRVMRRYIARHLRDTPGIVLAHDPLRQFVGPSRGGAVSVTSVRELSDTFARAGAKREPIPRAWSLTSTDERASEALTEFALKLGEKSNTSERVTRPILVPYDEGALREGSGSTWMGKLDAQFIVLRRHRGVGGLFNIQEAGMLVANFYRMSTDVILFQMPSDRARELDVKLYLEKGTLERAGVTQLPLHHFLRVRPRVGVITEPL